MKKLILFIALFTISAKANYEYLVKSTVKIQSENSTGSGFYILPNAVLTNYHVVSEGLTYTIIEVNGAEYEAHRLLIDPTNDLALLVVKERKGQSLSLGNDHMFQVGSPISIIGSPRGLIGTYSKGIVSAKRDGKFQITAPISAGSSGSPVFYKNKVIGVVSSGIHNEQNLNFAINISKVYDIINKLSNYMKITNKIDKECNRLKFDEIKCQRKKMITLAEKGFIQEQLLVGETYNEYNNNNKALNWYTRAANNGSVLASIRIATPLLEEKNYEEASYWLKKASNNGSATAKELLLKLPTLVAYEKYSREIENIEESINACKERYNDCLSDIGPSNVVEGVLQIAALLSAPGYADAYEKSNDRERNVCKINMNLCFKQVRVRSLASQ